MNGSAYVDVIGSGGGSIVGSGAVNRMAYWDGVLSLAAGDIYIDPATSFLGIGVAAPVYAVDIDGDINQTTGSKLYLNGSVVFDLNTGIAIGGVQGTLVFTDIAIGSGALANSTGAGGGNNIAIGLQAGLQLTTGSDNVGVGELSLSAIRTGSDNVAMGTLAGSTINTGTKNICIGSNADTTASNLDRAGAIGYGATVSQSNSLNLGGGFTAVGIANPTPKATLDVSGSFAVLPYEVTLVNGLNSDITALVAAGMLRIVGPTGAFSIGGFIMPTGVPLVTGPVSGQVLYVFNSEAFAMTIVNEDASSTAINRIKTLTGADVTLRAGTSAATFVYDDSVDRWLLMSTN